MPKLHLIGFMPVQAQEGHHEGYISSICCTVDSLSELRLHVLMHVPLDHHQVLHSVGFVEPESWQTVPSCYTYGRWLLNLESTGHEY